MLHNHRLHCTARMLRDRYKERIEINTISRGLVPGFEWGILFGFVTIEGNLAASGAVMCGAFAVGTIRTLKRIYCVDRSRAMLTELDAIEDTLNNTTDSLQRFMAYKRLKQMESRDKILNLFM